MAHENDYSFLDLPEILEVLFPVAYSPLYFRVPSYPLPGITRFIEVEAGIKIGCGFWARGKELPTILYFHGNGEAVDGHDWIAQFYNERGINLFVADYRGYGLSNGRPTVSNMLSDAHQIFRGFKNIVEKEGYRAALFVMGRSLGSLPAIELAYHYQGELKGLIVESGSANNFRRLWSYLRLWEKEKLLEESPILNKVKVRSIRIPTCIIHGELDELLPLEEGMELYQNSGAAEKDLLIIPAAGHNDLMIKGHELYFGKIEEFVQKALGQG